jgi:hypothetical protein
LERDSLLGERDRLKADVDALNGEVNLLKSRNQILLEDNESLFTALEHNLCMNQEFEPLSKSLEFFRGIKKVTDVLSRVVVIVAILSALMHQTKPFTRLRTIVESLFKNNIFGIEATIVLF